MQQLRQYATTLVASKFCKVLGDDIKMKKTIE
jgi:hypothetical protein